MSADKSSFPVSGGIALAGLVAIGLGVLLARAPYPVSRLEFRAYWPLMVMAGSALVGLVALWWWHRHVGSSGRLLRWTRRLNRNDGVASAFQIWRVAGRRAMRKKMTILRPSLKELPWWRRMLVPTRELASPVARVGWVRVWSPIEDVTLRVGGPRSGKSGEMAGRIADAPGAAIVTSTRTDLLELTSALRAEKGPVWVFNPAGLAGLESTITFDPLMGCTDATTANDRAADLLAGASAPGAGGDREFWSDQARRTLAALLHAAALDGLSMQDVLGWVADPDAGAAEITRALRRSVGEVVRTGGGAVPEHQRPHPVLDLRHDHAGAGLVDERDRCGCRGTGERVRRRTVDRRAGHRLHARRGGSADGAVGDGVDGAYRP